MEWVILVGVAVLTAWYLRSRSRSQGLGASRSRSVGGQDLTRLHAEAERYAEFNPFIRDVVRTFKRTGRISSRQVTAVREAITRIQEAQKAAPHIGSIGQDVTVEGWVMRVDYHGKGKGRRGRYVVAASEGNVIYDGPAVLVGRLGEVRFTATVRAHEYSATGHCDTVVDNVRDVAVLKRPSESYQKGG